ncbi:MAG TPA: citryl-CoA lyase, partial [Phycisphaerales bacterium]|nr:citryl-CoA lyase [Phycisphaerales bacterium]
IEPNHVSVRGYDIADLMGRVSVGQSVYLILRGELPSAAVGRLMDAILVSSIDHGATPPSVLTARTVASTGASLSAAVSAGLSAINKHHGGAIEDCARHLGAILEQAGDGADAKALEQAAGEYLDELKAKGRRMSGFGHRVHTEDPRTARLFELAALAGVTGPYLEAAAAVQHAFEARGKKLPVNVDGAIAAVLAQLGFDPAVMNGLFMIARTPGLVAHVVEEQQRMKPMRRIDPVNHTYDGPASRTLPHQGEQQ